MQRLQSPYSVITNKGLDCAAAQAQGWGHAIFCPLSGIALAGASRQLCHHWICKLWHYAHAGTATPCHLLCCKCACSLAVHVVLDVVRACVCMCQVADIVAQKSARLFESACMGIVRHASQLAQFGHMHAL